MIAFQCILVYDSVLCRGNYVNTDWYHVPEQICYKMFWFGICNIKVESWQEPEPEFLRKKTPLLNRLFECYGLIDLIIDKDSKSLHVSEKVSSDQKNISTMKALACSLAGCASVYFFFHALPWWNMLFVI